MKKLLSLIVIVWMLGVSACSSPSNTPAPSTDSTKKGIDSAVDTVKPNDSIIKG